VAAQHPPRRDDPCEAAAEGWGSERGQDSAPEIQLTDKSIADIDRIVAEKEKDLMAV
jgi:ribosome recycling factor